MLTVCILRLQKNVGLHWREDEMIDHDYHDLDDTGYPISFAYTNYVYIDI